MIHYIKQLFKDFSTETYRCVQVGDSQKFIVKHRKAYYLITHNIGECDDISESLDIIRKHIKMQNEALP